jgi:hypothetical protein
MSSATKLRRRELEKRILRLHKGGAGILKIGKALGIGTGKVQRVLMERSRPFDVGVAEGALRMFYETDRAAGNCFGRLGSTRRRNRLRDERSLVGASF